MKNILELCRERFNAFVIAMNKWEVSAFENNDPSDMEYRYKIAEELALIYSEYLTSKTRLQGKLTEKEGTKVCTTFRNPPTYDSHYEQIVSVEQVNKKTILIVTETTDHIDSSNKTAKRYTYKIGEQTPLLERKQVYSSYKEKWVNEAL